MENPIFSNAAPGLIDSHSDTLTKAMKEREGLLKNNLHIDLERLGRFKSPVQVFSIWCEDKYVENAYTYANSVIDFYDEQLKQNNQIIAPALSFKDLERNAALGKISAILALEGGEPLAGDIKNLEHFYNRGVRLITLTWNRENHLGYGVSEESEKGLKDFGTACVKKMNELGIIIDVSHLNEPGFWDVDKLSEKPYVASHSNAFSVTAFKRNLTDGQIKAIVKKGGMIGLNMYPYFLSGAEAAELTDIIKHAKHFIKTGAENNLGLGCDFDGVDNLPNEIKDISSIKNLEEKFTEHFGKSTSNAILYSNYWNFFRKVF